MNMHVRTAGEAEHCRVGNYVPAVNMYKFGWGGGGCNNRKQQTRRHFQGQDTFEFQRIPKILRGHCAWKIEGGGRKDEEGIRRFRMWSQKREEQKEELKERGKGQRLREARAVEGNCMHVSFSCCASLCGILVITRSTLSLSELVPGLLWYMPEHLLCAICLLLMLWHGGHWADACCRGGRNHRQVRDPSSDCWTWALNIHTINLNQVSAIRPRLSLSPESQTTLNATSQGSASSSSLCREQPS